MKVLFPIVFRVLGRVISLNTDLSPRFAVFQFSGFIAVILPRLLILEIFTPLNAPLPNVSRLGNERSSILSEVQLLNALLPIVIKD